jgi:uncharacterized membrane protein YtjA (UPF0391 family)
LHPTLLASFRSSIPLAINAAETQMLKWALIFFVVSIVAGLFGFTGIAVGAAEVSKILFFIFLVLFAIFLVAGLLAYNKLR